MTTWFPTGTGTLVDDAQVDPAVLLVPFSRRYDFMFADVRVDVSNGSTLLSIGANAIGFGATLVKARCKSELLERWCQLAWEASGQPLPLRDVRSDFPCAGTVTPATGWRRDATGTCAGPNVMRPLALRHGILEVVERHFVTSFFDDGHGRLSVWRPSPSPPIVRICQRWQVRLLTLVFELDPPAPTVAVTVCRSTRNACGALGTAARLTRSHAVQTAQQEALMMYTTALHWKRRQGEALPAYQGILHASDTIDALAGELLASSPTEATEDSTIDADQLHGFLAREFGAPAEYVTLPAAGMRLGDSCAWRVFVAGTRSPARVARQPWPIG